MLYGKCRSESVTVIIFIIAAINVLMNICSRPGSETPHVAHIVLVTSEAGNALIRLSVQVLVRSKN